MKFMIVGITNMRLNHMISDHIKVLTKTMPLVLKEVSTITQVLMDPQLLVEDLTTDIGEETKKRRSSGVPLTSPGYLIDK
jgi:hypothetical protein